MNLLLESYITGLLAYIKFPTVTLIVVGTHVRETLINQPSGVRKRTRHGAKKLGLMAGKMPGEMYEMYERMRDSVYNL